MNNYKIGVLIPSTTKTLDCKSYKDSYLYKIFLKSFIKTIDRKFKGKNILYCVYVVVDDDDKIYSNDKERNKIISFISLVPNVSINFISSSGIEKGWVTKMWNRAFKHAYDDGCHYFYQCGDDIEFLDKKWVIDCIRAMEKHRDYGITGPIDWGREQHNIINNCKGKFILTQTFVSRKHMDNFGFYFPEEIKNWFCDDWITYVYISKKKYWPIEKRILNKGGTPRYTPEGKGPDFVRMTKKCNSLISKYNKLL
tara:strand:+ start:6888 stop:7646 length:759 start_codon:yes stop_codon:yes gene_type:complete